MKEPKGPGNFFPKKVDGYAEIATGRVKEELQKKVELLAGKLGLKYDINSLKIMSFVHRDLSILFEVFGNLDNSKNKRILDIGCGSNRSLDELPGGGSFEPWFCRLLQEMGAHPVGVDRSDSLKEEDFENYVLDLSKPGALNIFPNQSFDRINLRNFFSSPSLRGDVQRIKTEISNQIRRLLKDGGKLLKIS